MERLTEWRGEHAAITNHHENYIDRLAAYEDAEEQGRLVRLPCKVGDRVYVQDGDQVRLGTVKNISITTEVVIRGIYNHCKQVNAIPHRCECCVGCELEQKSGGCDGGFILSPKRAMEYIEGLSKPRWIPATEALPEDGQIVLCYWYNIYCSKKDNYTVMRFRKGRTTEQLVGVKIYSSSDQWGNNLRPYCWDDPHGPLSLFGQDVSHWMPLPEPPKEDEP